MNQMGGLEDQAKRIMVAVARLATHDADQVEIRKELIDLVAEFGASLFEGTIYSMGYYYSIANLVNFYVPATNETYFSVWPDSAFELAKVAVSGGKPVYVIANGDPIGQNIVAAMV